MAGTYLLIGAEHSLFTAKLRAYLRCAGLPFEEVPASSDIYRTVIKPRTGTTFIPVLVGPDRSTVLQDTHVTIQRLDAAQPHPAAGPRAFPASPCQGLAARLLELYADEWLLLPAMHYRWSFPEQRALLCHQFGKTALPAADYAQQLAAGERFARRFAGSLPALGISQETAPVIEARLAWQLATLQAHFAAPGAPRFLLGDAPCIADYGFAGPLAGHLWLDPVPSRLLKNQAPLVADWLQRLCGFACPTAWQPGRGRITGLRPADAARPAQGSLLVEREAAAEPCSTRPGAVSASVLALLHHCIAEALPVLAATLQQLQRYASEQQAQAAASDGTSGSGLVLPRHLGWHEFVLLDPGTGAPAVTARRLAASHAAWRASELAAWWHQQGGGGQAEARRLLGDVGRAGGPSGMVDAWAWWQQLLQAVAALPGRIERQGSRLVLRLDARAARPRL